MLPPKGTHPMNIFLLFTRHFWLLALVVTGVNAAVYAQRIHRLSLEHPERAAGYRSLLVGFLAVSDIVWLVMGVGILFGGLPSVFAYFSPAGGNPFVLAWHATLVALWIAGIVWLFFRDGAQFFVDHPGIVNPSPTRPIQVQLWYLVCIAGGVMAEIAMWSGFFPPI
jgi:hypothetical protein